jgi:hypothetical protein
MRRHNKIHEVVWEFKSIKGNMAEGYWGEWKSNGLTNDQPKKY